MAIPGHEGNRVEHSAPLHVCGECASELVYPTEWEEAGPERWTVSLTCPNCEWSGTGTFHQELVDALDDELDNGIQALIHELRELARANLAEEVERFVAALRADAILPMDF